MNTQYLTVDEVAELLRIHRNTVYRWCREGQLEARRFGKGWRIPRSAVEKLASSEHAGGLPKQLADSWPPGLVTQDWCSAGDHVLAIAESREAVYRLEADFLAEGLGLNVRLFKGCWWQHPDDVRQELGERGLDVARLEAKGRLVVADLQKACDREGPEGAASIWVDETLRARQDGYERLWGCGSPYLAESSEVHERFRRFEALLSYRLNGLPVIGLCSYVLDLHVPDVLAKLTQIIRNHWGLLTYAAPDNIAFARLKAE
jgi:excisionase family DNA binding protein